MELFNQSQPKVKPEALTAATFRQKVFDYISSLDWHYKGTLPCVIDFWAEWCGPCRMLAPIIDELAQEYTGKVLFYKVDTDAEAELAQVFGIRSIPTLLFVPLGGKPQMAVGALPKATLRQVIENQLLPSLPTQQQNTVAEKDKNKDKKEEPAGENEITPAQLQQFLANGNDKILLLDVRFPDEHAQRRIEARNQLLIPLPELEARLNELEPYRSHTIIAYCRSGARSAQATTLLRAKGFKVHNLRGGILAWNESQQKN